MTVDDIEEAILRLSPAELAKFRAWFAEFEAVVRDSGLTQFECGGVGG